MPDAAATALGCRRRRCPAEGCPQCCGRTDARKCEGADRLAVGEFDLLLIHMMEMQGVTSRSWPCSGSSTKPPPQVLEMATPPSASGSHRSAPTPSRLRPDRARRGHTRDRFLRRARTSMSSLCTPLGRTGSMCRTRSPPMPSPRRWSPTLRGARLVRRFNKGQKVVASCTGPDEAADGVSLPNGMPVVRPDLVRPTGRQAPA